MTKWTWQEKDGRFIRRVTEGPLRNWYVTCDTRDECGVIDAQQTEARLERELFALRRIMDHKERKAALAKVPPE